MEKVGAAYDKAGFDDDRAQRLNESPLFIKELGLLMAKHTQSDSRFRFVTAFDIVVPEDYDHATRLDMFRDRHSREFDNYNPAITDANYAAKATIKLAPGRRLKCRVFWINEAVSSDDCLGFLRNQKAILTGAQGASLAYEQGKDRLPKSRYYVSFDDKDALWKDSDSHHMLPSVYPYSYGAFDFLLGLFETESVNVCGLLCFCDEE